MKKSGIFILILMLNLSSCTTDDVEPVVSLSSDVTNISESGGIAKITASINSNATIDIEVELNFAGTATINTDFTISSQTLRINAGSRSGEITLNTVNDNDNEGNETIVITVASITGASSTPNQSINITIEDDDAPFQPSLLINEVLYDPSNTALQGDANGDGFYAQNEDEFIEILNLSSRAADISGYKVYDTEALTSGTPRHLFPANTLIPAGGCLVLFGGGNPTGSFGGSVVQKSSTGDINMNNAGDVITITDASDIVVLTIDIAPYSDNPNESYTRNPDITGDFVQHHTANAAILFSPGTKVDGTNFK
jgi:hypothetical protein